MAAPEYGELTSISGTEIFSLYYRVVLKNLCLFTKRNKGTPFLKAPLFIIATVTNIFFAYRETKLKNLKH